MLLTCIRGEAWPRVPPPPPRAERRLGYPQANFFFLPYPITSSISPFSLSLRGFLFFRVYFPIRLSFRVSEGEIRVNRNCFYYPTLCLCGFIRPILIFCYFLLLFFSLCYVLALSFVVDAVFFADLPILLPSVGLSSLLRVIIHLGVFRGSKAKK